MQEGAPCDLTVLWAGEVTGQQGCQRNWRHIAHLARVGEVGVDGPEKPEKTWPKIL